MYPWPNRCIHDNGGEFTGWEFQDLLRAASIQDIPTKKTSAQIRSKWEQSWLDRYPWPKRCIHDNGGEFTGWEFQNLLRATSIKDVPTKSRNPQANAICERMNQTVGNVPHVLLYTNTPRAVANAADIIDQVLATAIHSMRVNTTTTLKGYPVSLVFVRDIFLDINLIAYW